MSAYCKHCHTMLSHRETDECLSCQAQSELAPARGSVAYKSCAQWPDGCADAIGNYSEDTHATREAADAVCQMLLKQGFGGNCQHYPVRVWIEEVTPLNDSN